MRLINTKTGAFEEFLGEDIPEYAILSHTWGEGEVTYQDYIKGVHKTKKGYRKIQKTCDIAAEARIPYTWIDTCCIDKKSSAELSEAINSMFRWYAESKVCYAFLSDLSGEADITKDLGSCRWFTRGWTLQELIAPRKVLFFDARWRERGYKTSIAAELSTITKIDPRVLRNESPLSEFCVAQKLSWAAGRETKRKEDRAYCLLGLLDLNLPLLYGEGDKAFRRLQDEIIRSNADLSIFAWSIPRPLGELTSPAYADGVLCGVLADSPDRFESCSEYKSSQHGSYKESSVTNVGVKIRAEVLGRRIGTKGAMGYVLPLNCTVNGRQIGLRLRQVGYDEYLRANPFTLLYYDENSLHTTRPTERQLLTALPKAPAASKIHTKHETDVLPSRRTHVLRITGSQTVLPMNPWPADRYDIEDQLFFLYQDPSRDFGVVDVTILVQSPKIARSEWKWVRCQLFALYWSSPNRESAQFGIIEKAKYAPAVRAIQSYVTEWNQDSKLLAYYLNEDNIPKCTSLRYLLPAAGYVAHISFVSHLREDDKVSTNPFWSIEFSCVIWTLATEPRLTERTWAAPGH